MNAPRHKGGSCCAKWDELSPERKADPRWQILHTLAHSRVAFNDSYFALLADITLTKAQGLTYEAKQMAWIKAGETTPGFDQASGTLWVGRLAATRK